MQVFADTSDTTAITVTPREPFKSFWQRVYTPPNPSNDPNNTGFGIGISPGGNGVNIYNESILFHEVLHGMTALYEDGIPSSLQVKNSVLSACPSFR